MGQVTERGTAIIRPIGWWPYILGTLRAGACEAPRFSADPLYLPDRTLALIQANHHDCQNEQRREGRSGNNPPRQAVVN